MNEQEYQVQENDHAAMEIHELRSPSMEENANGGGDIQIEEMNLEGNGERDNNQGQLQRTVRKRSKAHENFEEIILKDGTKKFKCKHCRKDLCRPESSTTTHLWNHLRRCLSKKLNVEKQKRLILQPAKSKFDMNPLSDGRYDHMKQREAIAHWILMHEQPFNSVENCGFTFMFQVNLPQFERISRGTIRSDVINVYDIEKKKLHLTLKGINKISLTTDIWKSKVKKISYMCVTGHYVDSDWHLQKRVLSFIPLPPPHTGVDLIDGLMKCIKDWGIEHKVFAISVDNASNNDVAIRIAKETFSRSRKLPLGGKLFHVRCAAHILNLVAQDGLSVIKCIIEDVKESVRFFNQSEARLLKFSEIVHHLGIPVKKLSIDCPTRWNSTYEMLAEAMKVKDAFPIFAEREVSYTCCPSPEDWNKVADVVEILEVFYEATHVMSGTNYPTSNVFLAVIWRVKYILNEKENHSSEFIRGMVKKMKEKFDKYWGECNLLMAIGAILDPRFKMRLVEFSFKKIYNENVARTNMKMVRDVLYDLFSEYVEAQHTKTEKYGSSMSELDKSTFGCTSSTSSTFKKKTLPSSLFLFDQYLDTVEVDSPVKSELDMYLEDGVFRCKDGEGASQFDVLAWWKTHELKFNILSKLARDVLAIPISTVASEATFSAGTRILDPYRANLSNDIVQVLICGADWVRHLHGINKSIMTYEEEDVIEVLLKS